MGFFSSHRMVRSVYDCLCELDGPRRRPLIYDIRNLSLMLVLRMIVADPPEVSQSSSTIVEIGIRDGGLYRLSARLLKALVHDPINSMELWHRRLAHLH